MEKNAVNPELAEFVRARSGIRPHRIENAVGRIQTRRPSTEWPVKPGEEESEVPDGFESQIANNTGTGVPQQDGVPAEKHAEARRYSVGGHDYVISHDGYGKRGAPVITVRRDGRVVTDGVDRVADYLAEGAATRARKAKTAAIDPYEAWIQENVHDPKHNCFFYAAALANLHPELKLFKGQHSGQHPDDTGHFYLKAPDGRIIDPTAKQFRTGKLVDPGYEVSVHNNSIVNHALFETLSEGDQKKIRDLQKVAAGEQEFLAQVRDEAKKKGYEIFAVAGPPGESGASVYHSRGPKEESAAWNARRAHIEWEKARGIDPQHDWSKTAAEFAPGIPEDKRIHPIPRVEIAHDNPQWDVVFSKHPAERRGDHIDVRLVDHHGKAHSWAIPPELPAPGKSVYAVQQPTHTGEYALQRKPFEIAEGYGKTRPGAQIEPLHIGKAEVVEANDDKVRFLSHGRTTSEYVLRRIGSAGTEHPIWAFHNATKTRATSEGKKIPDYKPSYKVQQPSSIDFDNPNTVMTAKIDGAHTVTMIPGDGKHLRVFSYRTSAADPDRLIEHTHKLPDFQKHIGDDFKNTVLRTEMWFSDRDGKAAPVETTGGLLNASTLKSRQRQEELGLTPRLTVIDVVRHDGKRYENKPFSEKLDVMKRITSAIPVLEMPIMATTPEQKRDLFEKVQSGKLPETREGVVEHHLHEPGYVKAVFRPTTDVYVTGVFKKPRGEARGHAGGFEYSTTPGGDTVGRVGTGFDHATRKDMMESPEKYIGRVARVESMKYTGGTLRTPAFKGWHIDKTDPELLKEASSVGAAVTGLEHTLPAIEHAVLPGARNVPKTVPSVGRVVSKTQPVPVPKTLLPATAPGFNPAPAVASPSTAPANLTGFNTRPMDSHSVSKRFEERMIPKGTVPAQPQLPPTLAQRVDTAEGLRNANIPEEQVQAMIRNAYVGRTGKFTTTHVGYGDSKVGRIPLYMPKAAAEKPYRERVEVYGVRDGKILVGRYPDGGVGTYGGGIDPGETPEAAAKREYQEEGGLRIGRIKPLNVPPFVEEWRNRSNLTEKERARLEKFRGSRTHFYVGAVGDEKTEPKDVGDIKRFVPRRIETVIEQQRDILGRLPKDDRPRTEARLKVLERLGDLLGRIKTAAAPTELVEPGLRALTENLARGTEELKRLHGIREVSEVPAVGKVVSGIIDPLRAGKLREAYQGVREGVQAIPDTIGALRSKVVGPHSSAVRKTVYVPKESMGFRPATLDESAGFGQQHADFMNELFRRHEIDEQVARLSSPLADRLLPRRWTGKASKLDALAPLIGDPAETVAALRGTLEEGFGPRIGKVTADILEKGLQSEMPTSHVSPIVIARESGNLVGAPDVIKERMELFRGLESKLLANKGLTYGEAVPPEAQRALVEEHAASASLPRKAINWIGSKLKISAEEGSLERAKRLTAKAVDAASSLEPERIIRAAETITPDALQNTKRIGRVMAVGKALGLLPKTAAKDYGPGGKWIHDRAHRIMEDGDVLSRYGDKDGKSVAYAIATQQAHAVKKSPSDFRTSAGVVTARRKYDTPKQMQKTAEGA